MEAIISIVKILVILSNIYPTILSIESNSDYSKIGDNGRAFGGLQIHKICVDDVNRIYNTEYTHEQMFIEDKAKEVFYLYLLYGYKLYKNKFRADPSEEDFARMWNGGIYNGYNKKSTINYYKKFKNLKYG